MHWLVRGIWKVVKGLLDEFTIQKIHIKGHDFKEDLHHYVDTAKIY